MDLQAWNRVSVSFDEKLDVSVVLQAELRSLLPSSYTLVGVTIHRTTFGDDCGASKHYYTFVKTGPDWYLLDDISWRKVNFDAVLLDGKGRVGGNAVTVATQVGIHYCCTHLSSATCLVALVQKHILRYKALLLSIMQDKARFYTTT